MCFAVKEPEVGHGSRHLQERSCARADRLIRRMALNPLIASEIEATAGKQHHERSITPANYALELVGEQQVSAFRCFVARAIPNRPDKYLFEGNLWIDDQDYAIVRIEGHPGKKLLFSDRRGRLHPRESENRSILAPTPRPDGRSCPTLTARKVLRIDQQNYALNETLNKVAIVEAAKGL